MDDQKWEVCLIPAYQKSVCPWLRVHGCKLVSVNALAHYSRPAFLSHATHHTSFHPEMPRSCSFVDYLLRLAAERYQVLAQWPDFSTAVSATDNE